MAPAAHGLRWQPSTDRRSALAARADELKRLRRFEEALAAYAEVLAQNGSDIGALNECGGLHMRLGRPEAALACYDRALPLAPRTFELHINKGTALVALNRHEAALAAFAAAAAVDPDRAEAHYNASLVRLRLGDFAAGWPAYEWRWRKAEWAAMRRNFAAPLWLGVQPIAGKTLLLHAEQGLGDTIQFIRYAPLLAGCGATIVLECQPALKNLVGHGDGIAHVIARGETLPAFDLHCPLLSLPLACGTQLKTVPANVPYLRPHPELLGKGRGRVPDNGRLRVGVCWAGSAAHLNDRNRSIPLERLADILTVPGIDFVSLQRDVSEADAAILRRHGVTALGEDFADFADTAAVVAMLDLVISVDTSVAHLAGAMAKATAVLLPFSPDFRWLLDRSDSPWYPTMRLYRQTAIGDWSGPLQRLTDELAAVARRRSTVSC
jgi:Tetratricopeptide repeat